MPWKFRERPTKETSNLPRYFRLAGIALLCLILALSPYAYGRLRAWNERRHLVRAQAALIKQDYPTALFEARVVLNRDPKNFVAQEIVDKTNVALKTEESMAWRRTAAALESGDTDRLLGLAEGFLAVNDLPTADRALRRIKEKDRTTARFHDLSARVAAARGDTATATKHWLEAERIAPDAEEYRVGRLALSLSSTDDAERAVALRKIEELKIQESLRPLVLRTLITDAKRRGDRARARDLAAELAALPEATFSDKMHLLEILRALEPRRDEEFSAYLAQLQETASADPKLAFELASWMDDHDLALLVPEWAARTPAELFAGPPAVVALAQAYARGADWKRLRELTEPATWEGLEYLRLGFLTLALDGLDNPKAAQTTWTAALTDAQTDPDRLEKLGRACLSWRWKERTEEVLWKLGPSEWCPRWAMDYLWATALARRDTPKLYEASKLRLRMQPEEVSTRNNKLTLGLLLGETDKATHDEALALYRENPQNPGVAATYGLSLFIQGRAHEAAAVLEGFPREQLGDPAIALYFGAFLAAAGQPDRAAEYLEAARRGRQLPEEVGLAKIATALSTARSLEQRGEPTAAANAWSEALRAAAQQPAWLELLARTALDWKWQPGSDAALLKLAESDRAPAGAEDALWEAALRTGDATQIYRASQIVARARPQDSAARGRQVLLAVLGRRAKDSPHERAEAFYKAQPTAADALPAYGLSLCQQRKPERAVALLAESGATSVPAPRLALYAAIFQSAGGSVDEAERQFQAGAPGAVYPEEKALAALLQSAFDALRSDKSGDQTTADAAWNRALSTAEGQSDLLEILARLGTQRGDSRHTEAALWKLAAEENCPRWAIDALWDAALKHGTSAERYKASKLVTKADPKSVSARATWILLALLTGQDADAPDREAKSLQAGNILDPEANIVAALSLHLQGKTDDALALLTALPPTQLQAPRVGFYYGLLLAASGNPTAAVNQLRASTKAIILPEERAFAQGVATDPAVQATLKSWPN
jgi:Tfp pilus assembly protein PilF